MISALNIEDVVVWVLESEEVVVFLYACGW